MRQLLVVGCLLVASACGGKSSTQPTPVPTPTPSPAPPSAPDVSGRYIGTWTLQVLRESDNFQTSFNCSGAMTVTQSPGNFSFGGFIVSSSPCEPATFDLSNASFEQGGAAKFRSTSPHPPQGPCPRGTDVDYVGTFTNSNRLLSAKGTTRVQCGDLGPHTYTYVITFTR